MKGSTHDVDRIVALAATPDENGNPRTLVSMAAELGVSVATVRKAMLTVDGRPRRAASAAKEQEEANTVLQVLRQAMLENGWAPSQRHLAEVTGFTPARVNYLMQILKHQGLVELGPNPREVRIVGSSMVIPQVSL